MKLETEHRIRALDRARRLLGVAAAFLLTSTACIATNRVGLDDGDGGAGKNDAGKGVVDPPVVYPTVAYSLGADTTHDRVGVATGSAAGPVTILDASNGTPLHILKPTEATLPDVTVGQGGGIVAVGNFSVWLFMTDGTLFRQIPGKGPITALALSGDGAFLFTADTTWTIRRYETATGAELPAPFAQLTPDASGGAWISSLAVSSDSSVVASCGNGVHVWRVSDGVQVLEIPPPTSKMALSASGELAVSDFNAVSLYSVTGSDLGRITFEGAAAYHLAYSADGTKLAVETELPSEQLGSQTVVRVIDRTTGLEVARMFDPQQGGLTPAIYGSNPVQPIGLAFVANDTAVALGWSDRRVTLFGVSDGLPIWSRVLDQ